MTTFGANQPEWRLDDAQQETVNWLTMLRNIARRNGVPEGYTYAGIGDFLLRHGEWHQPRPLAGYPVGAPRQCFGNALLYGRRFGLRYVEGYAVPALDGALLLPTHHAWNLDKDGNLIDATWRETGLAYLGVEFSLGRAENAIWFDDGNVLDNRRADFAIFRHPWHGESFNMRWRRSNKLRRLLALFGEGGAA